MQPDETVTKYIENFGDDVRPGLEQMRALIVAEVPEAVESFTYGLVGYKLRGKPLVYFGGFTHHIGFYATPNGHEAFKEEFANYKQGKGSVQFPLSEPLPVELITRVIDYRRSGIEK